jgi:hypothetical protein
MVQNQADRRMCVHCQRNVFPARQKPNIIAIIICAILVLPLIIYLIYYASLEQDRCPICYNRVTTIDYNYPPFRGTLESYDPSLINVGGVIRTQESLLDPEGTYIETIPDVIEPIPNNDLKPEENPIQKMFCPQCGTQILTSVKFCTACGHPIK